MDENKKKIGARGPIVSELFVFDLSYKIQWQESKVNLAELAELRWIEGWSRKDLADYYGRTEGDIQNYFQYIKVVKNFNI
jgi:hypothetical protein